MHFHDRRHAGQVLAKALEHYRDQPDVIVLALPRGGVPVAFDVAQALHVPLDVFVVRKLGFPGHEEYAMGAIAHGGIRVMNPDVDEAHLLPHIIEETVAREEQELERREHLYRGDRSSLSVTDCVVILIDDGLATGSTMRAAVMALKTQSPKRIVVAVPVAGTEQCQSLRQIVDEVVCAYTPPSFRAVGLWYTNFNQTTDAEVRALLEASWRREAETEPVD
jgi:putative phosphoribosyl transferase